jgi:ABC-type phosphate transport system substrate-binding protein
MAKRRLTALALVVIGGAALTGCGSSSTTPPANTNGSPTSPTSTTVAPVTTSGNGRYGY